MQRYAIRVELNGTPSGSIYEQLHAALAAANATRTIRADDGRWYHLPHATYFGTSDMGAMDVRDLIVGIVQSVWWDCDVIVFRYDDAAWRLTPVSAVESFAA